MSATNVILSLENGIVYWNNVIFLFVDDSLTLAESIPSRFSRKSEEDDSEFQNEYWRYIASVIPEPGTI